MTNLSMLSLFSRNRAAHLLLEVVFLWSLLPLQAENGSCDLNRIQQREYFAQGQAGSLPVVVDHRGKHSADQQLNAFARAQQQEFEAFEHTVTADREKVIRAFTPLPARVIHTQHTSSDL